MLRECVCKCIEDQSGCWLVYLPQLQVKTVFIVYNSSDDITLSKLMTVTGHRSVPVAIGTMVISLITVAQK